jgi:hypothetical protein
VISPPTEKDELTRVADSVSGELSNAHSVQDVAAAKRCNSKIDPIRPTREHIAISPHGMASLCGSAEARVVSGFR